MKLYFSLFVFLIMSSELFGVKEVHPDYSNLCNKIDLVLNSGALKNTKYGISIYSLTNNTQVYSNNAYEVLTPASTTKLFTSFAFLQRFGVDYNLKTEIFIDGQVANGTLNGDLYIRGGGDPLLSINDIEVIADQIMKYGINNINGNIYGDGSLFDKYSERIDYSGDKDIVQATPPITALSINKNIATVLVTSPNSKKAINNIQVFPKSEALNATLDETFTNESQKVETENQIAPKIELKPVVSGKSKSKTLQPTKSAKVQKKTSSVKNKSTKKTIKPKQNVKKSSNQKNTKSSKKTKKKYTYITPIIEQKYGEKRKSKSNVKKSSGPYISSSINADGTQSFRAKGKIARKASTSYSHFIKNPVLTTAGSLKSRLISGGVNVNGKYGERSIKEAKNPTKVFTFNRNSFEVIEYLMKHSDNYLSETLFKAMGALTKHTGTDVVSAQNLVLHYIDSMNFNCKDCIVNDGSGLSRRNKLSAASMTNLFKQTYKLPYFKYLDSSLSIAAYDGTLGNRMWDVNTRKNLRAKTGTHGNVSALTGLVKNLDGELFAFSFIFNGGSVNKYKKIENDLGIILANSNKNK